MSDALDTDKTMQPSDVPSPSAQLSPGTTLGQYGIIKLLGRGGMGEVYEVEHRVLRRKYALKLLPADFAARANALERFEREARVMANLEHPNIIRVDDFGETEGRYWLRMELAEGGQVAGQDIVTIEDYAVALGGRIPQDELLEILKQVVSALDYAHQHGAIHRDLKPSNILLAVTPLEGGEYLTVPKISDFGLVRLVGEEWVRSQAQISVQRSMSMGQEKTASPEGTSTRSLLGTYEYMSPEQKRGEEADERSDIYSVGLLVFRLLTGHTALGMDSPSEIQAELVTAWDELVRKTVKENPASRYQRVPEMLSVVHGIETAISADIEPEEKLITADPNRSGHRSSWLWAIAVTAAVVIILVVVNARRSREAVVDQQIVATPDDDDASAPTKPRITTRTVPEPRMSEPQKANLGPVSVGNARFVVLKEDERIWGNRDKFYWTRIPAEFKGKEFSQHNNCHRGVTMFRVLASGPVLMVVSDRWGGGGSGGTWQEELTTRRQLEEQGWKDVGTLGANHLGWTVFQRICRAGETYTYRTEKYAAPILLRDPITPPD